MKSRTAKVVGALCVTVLAGVVAMGQVAPRNATPKSADTGWRSTAEAPPNRPPASTFRNDRPGTPDQPGTTTNRGASNRGATSRRRIANIQPGNGSLPRDDNQEWRDYDITPYTLRVTSTKRPERAIVDWILRETGPETWNGEVVSVLAADQRRLRVYHTHEVQEQVADLVDRFVSEQTGSQAFGLQVVTLASPNWRVRAQRMLNPVETETAGVQAWLMRREDVALLLSELRKRTDFRELSTPRLSVGNGEIFSHVATRPRNFNQGMLMQRGLWSGFAPQLGQLEEGFSIEFSPLLSVDSQHVEGTLGCNIAQLEQVHPITVEAPVLGGMKQRTRVEIPQIVHYRFKERFRWPTDQVLVISLGMVPNPLPVEQNAWRIFGFQTIRADLLMFVQSQGALSPALKKPQTGERSQKNYHGRY